MPEEYLKSVIQFPFETGFAVFVLCCLRIFGFMYSFYPISWGFYSDRAMRMAVVVVLSSPLFIAQFNGIALAASNFTVFTVLLLSAKEFAIGYGLGLLASSPFRAMQYAGAVTDSFRGESDSGLTAPDGSGIQTSSVFFLIIGFAVFFGTGGLTKIVEMIYSTYSIWPLLDTLPFMTDGTAKIALVALGKALRLAIGIIAPIILLLFFVEVSLMIAEKLARRFGLTQLSFLVKNLVVKLTLPLAAILILRVAHTELVAVFDAIGEMRRYFN